MSTITMKRTCPFCHKEHEMAFDKDKFDIGMELRNMGALIQNAFPSFTPEQREFIMTGICSKCWDEM